MNIFVMCFLLIIISVTGFYNGYVAALALFFSIFMLYFELQGNYNLFYLALFLCSSLLTFYPLVNKPENKLSQFVPSYIVGFQQGLTSTCPGLSDAKRSVFIKTKEALYGKCSFQAGLDLQNIAKNIFSSGYSVMFTEFSMVYSLFHEEQPRNQCLECIEALIELCPGEEIYFDRKSLRILRETYKEYPVNSKLCLSTNQ